MNTPGGNKTYMRPYSRVYATVNLDAVASNMRSMRDNILPSHITAVLPLQGNKIGLRIITGTRCE